MSLKQKKRKFELRIKLNHNTYKMSVSDSLRASSPNWASEASLARTRERAAKPRGAGERKLSGAHQMEPPSPIQALGVNPFPSRFIIRTVPRGDFARRRWEEPITTTK